MTDTAQYVRRICAVCHACGEFERIDADHVKCANCSAVRLDDPELVPQKRESTVTEHQRLVAKSRGNVATAAELDAAGFKPHTPAPSGEPERGALGELQGNGVAVNSVTEPPAGTCIHCGAGPEHHRAEHVLGGSYVASIEKTLTANAANAAAVNSAAVRTAHDRADSLAAQIATLRESLNATQATLQLESDLRCAAERQLATLRESYDAQGAQLKAMTEERDGFERDYMQLVDSKPIAALSQLLDQAGVNHLDRAEAAERERDEARADAKDECRKAGTAQYERDHAERRLAELTAIAHSAERTFASGKSSAADIANAMHCLFAVLDRQAREGGGQHVGGDKGPADLVEALKVAQETPLPTPAAEAPLTAEQVVERIKIIGTPDHERVALVERYAREQVAAHVKSFGASQVVEKLAERDADIDKYKRWGERDTEHIAKINNDYARLRSAAESVCASESYGDLRDSAGVVAAKIAKLSEALAASPAPAAPSAPLPTPMRLPCPACAELHIDEGEFATKPHHTHSCQACGLTWRPAIVATVGVQFLPGFKNAPAAPSATPRDDMRCARSAPSGGWCVLFADHTGGCIANAEPAPADTGAPLPTLAEIRESEWCRGKDQRNAVTRLETVEQWIAARDARGKP